MSTQQRAKPRQQLRQVEGLDEVVVGADVEAGHAVVHRVARGEHQDRRRVAGASDATTDLESVDVGELQVEHDGVGRAQLNRLEGADAVLEQFDVVVLHPQGPSEGATNRGVVVDDRDVGVR